jgi:integrin beta 3
LPGVPGAPGAKGLDGVHGKDGANGLDGLGFDDFDEQYDGERTFTHVYRSGDRVKTFTHVVPFMIYRGTYEAGRTYQRGDASTWGGSIWVAKTDTGDKPGEGATGWQLAVKAGRDGREGKPGEKGQDGKPGKDGKPWT